MKEPWFWRDQSLAARAAASAMTPASLLYDLAQRLRAAIVTPRDAGAPVICVGNATLGGSGKTPFALLLRRLLNERGVTAHFSSRGYGGALSGPVRVTAAHTAEEVGDEALLLAAAAPTWIAKNRAAGARAAAGAGAGAVIMDDGFQNPTVKKHVSILLVSVADLSGNGRVFPAGPLREPFARAIARADIVVVVHREHPFGAPRDAASALIEKAGRGSRIYHAHTAIDPSIAPGKAVAFCGIAHPERFFESLERSGFVLTSRIAFADHHPFTTANLAELRRRTADENAALITTEKDFVRLERGARDGIAIARLRLEVDQPEYLAGDVLETIRCKI